MKKLDQAAKKFVHVLQKDDYAAFQAQATERLKKDLPKTDFHRIAEAFRALGKIKKRSQGGTRSDCSGSRMTGRFDFRFSKAKVKLVISIDKSGNLDAFSFKGGGLARFTGEDD